MAAYTSLRRSLVVAIVFALGLAALVAVAPAAPAAERGGSAQHVPGALPKSGKYAFLLKLDTASTGTRFRDVRRTHGAAQARRAAKNQLRTVDAAQDRVRSRLSHLSGTSQVLYRTHAAMAGIAVVTDVTNAAALARLPGVASVYPIAPKKPAIENGSDALAAEDVPPAWDPNIGATGDGVVIADIDTGIDYTHADFGGNRDYATAKRSDTAAPAGGAYDPNKVILPETQDGQAVNVDLVGDSYDGANSATPDPNPLDCASAGPDASDGHGTHTAGLLAGYGVLHNTTYQGAYDGQTDVSAMSLAPGVAPKARLLPIRVFGCQGSTTLISAAIDLALDPNGDGVPSDRANVINLSLGSPFGSAEDGDAVAVESAINSTPGVTVVVAAGNDYDVYDAVSSPGTAKGAITVAASTTSGSVADYSSRGLRAADNLKPDVAAVGSLVTSAAVDTGYQGKQMSGTSMATPMVAGLAALVLQKHPGWSPAEVKADIMNTAGHRSLDDSSGTSYAPMRIGAGLIDGRAAVSSDVIAYSADDPESVSLSWGSLEVEKNLELTKTISVHNRGDTAAVYTAAFAPATTVPGVTYSVPSDPLTVPPGGTQPVTVTLKIDRTKLAHSVDPTKRTAITVGSTAYTASTLAEASGDVVLTPTSGGTQGLRVPVYSAPRPAAGLSQPTSVLLSPSGVGPLRLSGAGLPPGVSGSALAAGFDLQASSGKAPACGGDVVEACVAVPDDRGADIRYVGATADAGHKLAYLAITSYGAHSTAASKVTFVVYVDTNHDGAPDFVAYNDRLADDAGAYDTDVFVVTLARYRPGTALSDLPTIDREYVNGVSGSTDTGIFDSNVMVLPLKISALGLSASRPSFRYAVDAYSSEQANPIDSVGFGASDGPALTANAYTPGVRMTPTTAGPLVRDVPGTTLTVSRDTAAYATERGKGLLLVHFHNTVGSTAEILSFAAPKMSLAVTSLKVRSRATVAVAITGATSKPTGRITIKAGGKTLGTPTLSNGKATVSYTPAAGGSVRLTATYPGNAFYPALTVAKTASVKKLASRPKLRLPKKVRQGKKATAKVTLPRANGLTPTGRVTLRVGGKKVATKALRGGRIAFRFKAKKKGRLAVVASYAGSAAFKASTRTVHLKVRPR